MLSEHSYWPPDYSVIQDVISRPISQDKAVAEIGYYFFNDNQLPNPEVTFFLEAKTVIGIRRNGFCFRLDNFLPTSCSRWRCIEMDYFVKLTFELTLNRRQIPPGEHNHPLPRDADDFSVANVISYVKALGELSDMRVYGTAEGARYFGASYWLFH